MDKKKRDFPNLTFHERMSLGLYGFGFTKAGEIITPEVLLVMALLGPLAPVGQFQVTPDINAALFEGFSDDEENTLRQAYDLPSKEGTSERDGEKAVLEFKPSNVPPAVREALKRMIHEAAQKIDHERVKELAEEMVAEEENKERAVLEKFHTDVRRDAVLTLVLEQLK